MNFPLLSSLILLPTIGALFIFFTRSSEKNNNTVKYVALFTSFVNFFLSVYLWILFDQTTSEWFNGTLANKPAGVFTSTSSLHGGQETTLLSMMLPLIHHGMIIVGVPYTEKKLATTKSGGTPYGPSHVSYNNSQEITDEEKEICLNYGKRIALLALKLES